MKRTIIFILMLLISFSVFSQSLKWNGNFVLRPDEIIGGPDPSWALVKITAQGGLDIRGLEVVHDGLIEKIDPRGTYIDVYIVCNGGTTTLEITSYTYGNLRIPVRTNDEIFRGEIYDISISLTEPPSPKLFNITYAQGIYNLSHEKATPGTNITFDLKRMPGMTLKYVTIGDKKDTSGAYSYSFTMPDNDVHIMAKWEEIEPVPNVNIPKSEFNYLTFTAQEPNSSVGIKNNNNNPDIEYSISGGKTWQKLTEQDSVVLRNVGDKMFVRGNNPNGFSSSNYEYTSFKMTGRIAASGSVMSLVDGKGESLVIPSGEWGWCFAYLFKDCESLISAPKLSATTLDNYCYRGMFEGCRNLKIAPVLPATALASYCYSGMFSDCASLITAPELPATTLASYCYSHMFEGCRNLKIAPVLPATALASDCYSCMFSDCASLIAAPDLPATTLASDCYSRMFEDCSSLTTAPDLPATTLTQWCYCAMFKGCSRLTTAPDLPATTLAFACYSSMFEGCGCLITAPDLPATTMVQDCYSRMFSNCNNLTSAPDLPANNFYLRCYTNMFYGCHNLKSIKVYFTDWPKIKYYTGHQGFPTYPTYHWLTDVSYLGVFYCPRALKKKFDCTHIPKGWTVEYID